MSELEQQSLAPFFRLAKNQCANFSEMGPRGVRHYCWIARETGFQCSLVQNSRCKWLETAVLPANADLLHRWKRIFEPEEVVKTSGWTKSARCSCGKLFRSKSNRQQRCPECSKKHARIMARQRKQKQRASGVACHALGV